MARAEATQRHRWHTRSWRECSRRTWRVLVEAAWMWTKRYVDALKRLNWPLVLAMVLLAAGSMAFIYSASFNGPGQPMPSLYKWQAVWFGAGLLAFLVTALV